MSAVSLARENPTRARVGYRFGPASIDFESDDPESVRWLTEFLTPWFDIAPPGHARIAVRLTTTPSVVEALDHRRRGAGVRPVTCFLLDSQNVELPGWVDGRETVIAYDELRCVYRVGRGSIEIVARPGDRLARIAVMRAVREAAAAMMLAQGAMIDLHAAAFTVGGRAVLLPGPKQSGKTTLLVSALRSERASLLANDRVFVDTRQRPAVACGVPTMVSLRTGTLARFPQLRHGLPARPTLLHSAELDAGVGTDQSDASGLDFALSSSQLARRLAVAVTRAAPIAKVIFPELDRTIETWALEPLTPEQGMARLDACHYGVRSASRPRTIFEDAALDWATAPVNPEHSHPASAHLSFFLCRLGRDAYRDGATAFLRALDLVPSDEGCIA